MKHLKQMACLTLAAVFTAGSAVPNTCLFGGGVNEVSASEVTGNKLTIGNPMEGHIYKVYQIFKGQVSSDGKKLSNVEYGKNYTGSGEAEMTAAKEAETLAQSVDGLGESEAAKEFAKDVRAQIESDTASEDQKAAFVVLNSENGYAAEVTPGYYLVVDESNREDVTNDVISDYIVGIIGKDVTVQPKAVTVPDFDKSIDEDAAAETPKKQTTLTITNPEDGYTYKVYQIFTGDVEDGKLINPGYGANYEGSGNLENDVAGLNDAADKKDYALSIKDAVKGDPVAVLDKNNPSVIVDGGFYVIIVEDEDGNEAADGTVADGEEDSVGVDPEKPEKNTGISPETANANWYYSLDDDANTITLNGYKGADTDVRVYGFYRVDGSDKIYKTMIKGENMFFRKSALTSIIFNHDVDTSTCTSMYYMFYECKSLQYLDVSCFNTSNVTNMGSMFYACESLTNLDISSFNTSNVTEFSHMFYRMEKLETLDLSNFNTGKVSSMNSLFASCSSLKTLNLSGWDVSSVTTMSDMFFRCSSLVSLDLSSFGSSNVTDTSGMFYECSGLQTLTFGNFDTSKVTNMGGMFFRCSSLVNLDLSKFDTSSVSSVNNSFEMNSMFQDCSSLVSLDVSNFDTSNVKRMDYMFSGCSSLVSLDLGSFDANDETNLNLMFMNCSALTDISIGTGWTVKKSGVNMFYGCDILPLEVKQKLDPSYSGTSSVVNALSLFSHAFASESGITTPDAIEIKGDDKTVDYAVGDHVPFKLEATMPESISAYEKYKLVFHDKITAGMKYDQNSLKVYADGTEVPAGNYTAVFGTDEDGKQTLTVTIDDVKAAPWNAVAGSKITVKYTAELKEEGTDGAFNEASLDYSNDPNGDGMGTTGGDGEDHDVVEVITFAMTFNKVNKSGDALPGAGFTLYRKGEDGEYAELETITGTTAFDFDGLKPGDYKLVESTTPDGYNTMEDLIFSIVKEESEADGEKVISVKLVDANGNALDDWSADAKNRAFVTGIANFSGSELPSTGGMGTYLFYIAGAALVILIGAVMVARKENKENE